MIPLGERFADMAAAHPDRTALVWSPTSVVTVGQLNARANQIARRLLAAGVRKGEPVALSCDKSIQAYAAMIACLKLGVPYFWIDPANPAVRTRLMLERCRPAVAIVGSTQTAHVFECPVIRTDGGTATDVLWDGIDAAPVDVPWPVHMHDPAYVMFTSGSTGTPKGATISHANLWLFIQWAQRYFGVTPADVFSNVNPLFFDNSVFDVYASVFNGASLAPVTGADLKQPEQVLAHLEQVRCTLFFSVPSLLIYFQRLKLVDRQSFATCRIVAFGGEGYPTPMLRRLFDAVGDRVHLHNIYGPTECTCFASAHRVTPADLADGQALAPLGQLIPYFSSAIVDATGSPATPGETGELYLGGPAVGLGYYGDPEGTRRAFVQNPTHGRYDDRMYRTGDLVRRSDVDGHLHFVGRRDSQIKRQGYRIELGEIEHALAAVPGVVEVAVLHMTNGPRPLVVAVVGTQAALTPAHLKQALGDSLPVYMLPDRIVVMEELPKNPNGKIDRVGIAARLAEDHP